MTGSIEKDMNIFEATELRLGLPGCTDRDQQTSTTPRNNKRVLPADHDMKEDQSCSGSNKESDFYHENPPPTKSQVVGWPPVRSNRRNGFQTKKRSTDEGFAAGMYVKVSMDGAPYLRKIDLKAYKDYSYLLKALENMFQFKVGFSSESDHGYVNGSSHFVPTYEDKDGDWMLVGDVPWDMFISSCKKLRIMKGSEVRGFNLTVSS